MVLFIEMPFHWAFWLAIRSLLAATDMELRASAAVGELRDQTRGVSDSDK
jgi:hypothetical protein